MTDEIVIKAEGLTKRFGNFTATDHVTFEVHKGEIFGFLGANGAGKTTAMRMLCGLSQPSDGKATVAGYDVATQYEDVKRHIGYMSQKFSLYDDLTVEENLVLFGGIYGMPRKKVREKITELLKELGFETERKTMVKSLPLGWKQKLAFSLAIFHEPSIVFLDEPTGGVDPVTRRQFWELIYKAADNGITVFVTTHYMDEAELIANIVRSVPFIILLVLLIPFTRLVVGKSYGSTATIVPLVIAAAPYIARMVESSLKEVDAGVIEAARSMGASNFTIITKVMLVEARTSLLVGATITLGTILGYSAMSGAVGGGGLGAIAIRYGYTRWQTDIMIVTVILLIILFQIFQTVGMKLADKFDHRK